MASGLDLSSFFEGECRKIKPAVFACRSSDPAAVMAGIERVGKGKKYKLRKVEENYKVEMLAAPGDGGKGMLSVTVEVFTVTPEVAVVEFTKSAGDAAEFIRFCEEVGRPALKQLIWTG